MPLAFLSAGCRQDMHDQPKYRPLATSTFFEDGRSARPLVAGTVPRGLLKEDSLLYTGKAAGQRAQSSGLLQLPTPPQPVPPAGSAGQAQAGGGQTQQCQAQQSQAQQGQSDIFPFQIKKEDLDRGEQQFNVFCSVCHDRLGTGNGMIVQRGFRRPPSYHIQRLREAKVSYFFDVITNGFGAMPDYSAQITPEDRWRIIAYIRALQLSQNATVADVPPDERNNLGEGGQQK